MSGGSVRGAGLLASWPVHALSGGTTGRSPARLKSSVPRKQNLAAACAVWAVGLLAWAAGLSLLVRRWQGVHPAVFEADLFSQRITHALFAGSLWPWDLGSNWYFLLMAPGVYLHIPVLALFPGGLAPLLIQAIAVLVTALLLAALARQAGASAPVAAGLGLVWLLHPISGGVAMAWGWSPYISAAPLLIGGLLALERGRRGTAAGLFAAAALMKINGAVMIAGIGAWLVLEQRGEESRSARSSRPAAGRMLLVGGAAWAAVAGLLFSGAALCAGTLLLNIHLDTSGAGPTAGGTVTVALTLLPALPLLDRRGWALVAFGIGVEMAYTLVINPANSGLVPATAVLLAAGALRLPFVSHPGRRVAVAVALSLLCHQLFQPPHLSPLPLHPAAVTYRPDPARAVMRSWVEALPEDAGLVISRPTKGAVGTHRGPVLEPWEWDGRGTVAVLLEGPVPERYQGCLDILIPETTDAAAIWAGSCGAGPPASPPRAWLDLKCLD